MGGMIRRRSQERQCARSIGERAKGKTRLASERNFWKKELQKRGHDSIGNKRGRISRFPLRVRKDEIGEAVLWEKMEVIFLYVCQEGKSMGVGGKAMRVSILAPGVFLL